MAGHGGGKGKGPGGGHKGGGHHDTPKGGPSGHTEHAPKVEEKFNAAKMLADAEYVKFVDAYAEANKLDKALLSVDNKQLEAIWKKYLIKKDALKEFSDFYSDVLKSDLGIQAKDEPEANKFLAEVGAHLSEMAVKKGYDPAEKLQGIKKIKTLQGQQQIDLIRKLGLEAEYFPLGFVDENRLLEDERNLTLLAKRQSIKKEMEVLRLNRHILPDPLSNFLEGIKKKKIKKIEDEMSQLKMSLEDPTLDGTDKIKQITESIHNFKKVKETVHEGKHALEHELEVHVGPLRDGDKSAQLDKAQERLKKLDRILKAPDYEQFAAIRAIGQRERYVIPASKSQWTMFDQIDLKKIKHDIAQLKAALAEHGLHAEKSPDLQAKKDLLEKAKKQLLESKMGSRTALKAAQETLFDKLAWLMTEEHALTQQSQDLVNDQQQWQNDNEAFMARKKVADKETLARVKVLQEERQRLEKYKKELKESPPDDPAEAGAEALVLSDEEKRLKNEEKVVNALVSASKKEEEALARRRAHLDDMQKKQDRLTEVVRHYEKAKNYTAVDYMPAGGSQKSFTDLVDRAKNVREARMVKNIEYALSLLTKPDATEVAFGAALEALKLSQQEKKQLLKKRLEAARQQPLSVARQRWIAEAIKNCN